MQTNGGLTWISTRFLKWLVPQPGMRSPTGATQMPGWRAERGFSLNRSPPCVGSSIWKGFAGNRCKSTRQVSQLLRRARSASSDALAAPAEWTAAPLIRQCCRSLLASFKIWNTATVGGNICMSLPAGAMISLTAALEGVCTIWQRDGGERRVPVVDFVTGVHQNVLGPGDLLRSIDLPASALHKRTSFRRMSLTHMGRSSVLLIGTLCPREGSFALTVTAATVRPVRIEFPRVPAADQLRSKLREAIPDAFVPG